MAMIAEKKDMTGKKKVDATCCPNGIHCVHEILACDGHPCSQAHDVYDDAEHHHNEIQSNVAAPSTGDTM